MTCNFSVIMPAQSVSNGQQHAVRAYGASDGIWHDNIVFDCDFMPCEICNDEMIFVVWAL